MIARALATEAPILLLDEPTSALDIGHQQQALELVVAPAERPRADGDLGDARPDAGRHVRRPPGAAARGHASWPAGTAAEVLRAETLAEFYGVRVSVHHEPDGTVIVVPRREGAITWKPPNRLLRIARGFI